VAETLVQIERRRRRKSAHGWNGERSCSPGTEMPGTSSRAQQFIAVSYLMVVACTASSRSAT